MYRNITSTAVVNVEDLRHIARQSLPRVMFDYLDDGAEAEITVRDNCRAFADVVFRPRQAVAFDQCDLRTRVLGADVATPVLLPPVGYSRLMHPGGEAAAAGAAGAAAVCQPGDEDFRALFPVQSTTQLNPVKGAQPWISNLKSACRKLSCDCGLE